MRTMVRNTFVILLAALLCVVLVPHDASSAYTPMPSGTGIYHVVGGHPAATASPIVNADVSPTAAIGVAKLASGTNGQVLTTTAGVPTWGTGGGAASAGAAGQVQTSDGAGGFTAPANVFAGANEISVGVTPATVGAIRLPNTFNVSRRNGTNTADETILASTASTLSIGGPDSGTASQFFSNLVLNAYSQILFPINGTSKMAIDSSGVSLGGFIVTATGGQFNAGTGATFGAAPAVAGEIRLSTGNSIKARNAGNTSDLNLVTAGTSLTWGSSAVANTFNGDSHAFFSVAGGTFGIYIGSGFGLSVGTQIKAAFPIVGDSGQPSPYGVHGGVAVAPATDTNITLTSAQYALDWIEIDTGAWITGPFGVILPTPASKAAGFYKTIYNASTKTITLSNGGVATRTLATLLAQRFWIESGGVFFAGPTWTP